jgi:1-phosphofructokinase/tagatose 6-phosphate kinase
MRVGLRAQPAVVVPNVTEAEEAVGYEFTEPSDLVSAVDSLVGMGAEEAIVTTPSGCVAIVGEGNARTYFEASIEPLATVASVGSGDAFLAGFVAARRAGRPVEDCLAYGVACGAESTQHLGAGTIDGVEAVRLTDRVSVERLSAPLRVA